VVYREQGMKGQVFRTSLADYTRARSDALRRKSNLLSHGLYGIGPHPELIGEPVNTLGRRLVPVQATMNAELRTALGAVDTGSSFIPANLAGSISGIGVGTPLAVALNGRVAAVGWSAQLTGDTRTFFSFMVPPDAFKQGRNTAQVYEIRP
jgi:hypothetical protein